MTIGQNRDTRVLQRCQYNRTPINIIAGLKEDQRPDGSDLDEDGPLPLNHLTSGSPKHHQWQGNATQRQMGRDTGEAVESV